MAVSRGGGAALGVCALLSAGLGCSIIMHVVENYQTNLTAMATVFTVPEAQRDHERNIGDGAKFTGEKRMDTLQGDHSRGGKASRFVKLEDLLRHAIPKETFKRIIPFCTVEACAANQSDCWCSGDFGRPPANIAFNATPQIIFWSFDDFVDRRRMETFRSLKLLHHERRNPNGCPISATFFINDAEGSPGNYSLVRRLYDLGHEIAVHSLTHEDIADRKNAWEREMVLQRDNIHRQAGIPVGELRGMRAPQLHMGGDHQFQVIQDNGFQWDSTAQTGGFDDGHLWPFKVGQRFSDCWNAKCPRFHRFSGFWEVPLGEWQAPDSGSGGCAMADMCESMPVDRLDMETYLWKNFLMAYLGNRAPLPMGFHAYTFQQSYHKNGAMYVEVMNEFLDNLNRLEDVYFVSISQMMDWVQDPQPLDKVKDFDPWKKTCALQTPVNP